MVVTDVQYGQMLERLLGQIGAELGVTFRSYSLAAWEQGAYDSGASTYEYDNRAYEITLCIWLNRLTKRCATVPGPAPHVSADDEASFKVRLKDAVTKLIHPQSQD